MYFNECYYILHELQNILSTKFRLNSPRAELAFCHVRCGSHLNTINIHGDMKYVVVMNLVMEKGDGVTWLKAKKKKKET